jgi:hypothetical protein
MTATDDPTTDRLVKEIGLRTFADKYLDRDEEREVIRIAGQLGLAEGEAAATVARVCASLGLVREELLRDTVRVALAREPGKLDRAAFDRVAGAGMGIAQAVVSERDVRRVVIRLIDETNRANVKRGWFSNWYAELKEELGVV